MSTIPDNLATAFPAVLSLPAVPVEEFTPRAKRWNRKEYYQLAAEGMFNNQRVELIGGVIYEVSPQSTEHFYCYEVSRRILEKVFGDEYWVRSQGPLVASNDSEPEPDLCVVPGPVKVLPDHPSSSILTLEISKSSIVFDRLTKACLYASMNIPDYWVLDIDNRQLWVHRLPVADETMQFGHRYSQVEAIAADGHVASLEKPEARIAVADMLPPAK
jgi:Uma2 family endonuclease